MTKKVEKVAQFNKKHVQMFKAETGIDLEGLSADEIIVLIRKSAQKTREGLIYNGCFLTWMVDMELWKNKSASESVFLGDKQLNGNQSYSQARKLVFLWRYYVLELGISIKELSEYALDDLNMGSRIVKSIEEWDKKKHKLKGISQSDVRKNVTEETGEKFLDDKETNRVIGMIKKHIKVFYDGDVSPLMRLCDEAGISVFRHPPKCASCGRPAIIDHHHIKKRSQGGSDGELLPDGSVKLNLEYLCILCHDKVEKHDIERFVREPGEYKKTR